MSTKKKKRVKSKISSTEVRTPINLSALASNQKFIPRPSSNTFIPFVKPHSSSQSSQKFSSNVIHPSVSLRNFSAISENPVFSEDQSFRSSQVPVKKIDFQSETFSQNDGDFDEFRIQMNKFVSKPKAKIKTKGLGTGGGIGAEKILAEKYKAKFREKMNEVLSKQSEMHKFEIESIRNQYEGKILRYKQIIKKLQEDYEVMSGGKDPIEKSQVLNPLIEENIWLKNQISTLKRG